MLAFRPTLTSSIAPLLAVALLLAPGLGRTTMAGGPTPTAPDAIVFADPTGAGDWEIWAIRPGEAAPRPVLQRPGISFESPAWSPDGTHIAFRKQVSNRVWRVMVMRADGTDIRVVTSQSPLGTISWSPDGTRLAFSSQVEDHAQLFTVDVSGENLTQVTDGPSSLTEPIWSHDGTRLFHQFWVAADPFNHLHVINVDGTGRQPLTVDPVNGYALSPDGSQLAVGLQVDGVWQVHLMPSSGGTPTQITDGEHDANPSDWSPDGDRILFLHWTRVETGTLTSMAPDGSDHREVLDFVQRHGNWGRPAFVDSIDHPLAAHIAWAVDSGLSAGCDIAEFCPNRVVTREQLAAMLARAFDLPPATQDHFTDDELSRHEDDINRLAEAGIAEGCAPQRFCPFAVVTRAQGAAVMDRALSLPATTTDPFTDDDGLTHEPSINRAAAAGIVTGCASDLFCPTRSLTRAQLVTLLHRALD